MTEEVSQEHKVAFMKECTLLRILPKEVCLTIQLGSIINYYVTRIGIHPVLESWEELHQLLAFTLKNAKNATPHDKKFHVRFAGGNTPVWLTMRIYAMCIYEADAMFYAGDCIIKV